MYDLARSKYKKLTGFFPYLFHSVSVVSSRKFMYNQRFLKHFPVPAEFLSLHHWFYQNCQEISSVLLCDDAPAEWQLLQKVFASDHALLQDGQVLVRRARREALEKIYLKNVSLLYNVPFGLILIAGLLDCLLA